MARSRYHLIWNSMFVYEVEFSSVIRGHHVYKAALSPIIGESLAYGKDNRKDAKELDEYAVGTYREADNKLVGHVPMELSFLIFTFLKARHENNVQVKVTDQGDWKTDLLSLDPFWPERPVEQSPQNLKRRLFI